LAVKINGNHGTQQEFSVSTKVSKEIVPFQLEFPIQECDVKNDPIEKPESGQKNLTLTPSFVRNPTPSKNLQLLTTLQPWSTGNSAGSTPRGDQARSDM